MGGPALLPGTVPPPKQRRLLPWTQAATLPVPKPARSFPRRRGQDPFADIVAGVQNLIQNIGKGAHPNPDPMTICCTVVRAHRMLRLQDRSTTWCCQVGSWLLLHTQAF